MPPALKSAVSHSLEVTTAHDLPAIATRTEFDDVRLILRRWQAARIGDALPPYEELALGSIGRCADEIAVVRCEGGNAPFLLRAGQRFLAIDGLEQPSHYLDR